MLIAQTWLGSSFLSPPCFPLPLRFQISGIPSLHEMSGFDGQGSDLKLAITISVTTTGEAALWVAIAPDQTPRVAAGTLCTSMYSTRTRTELRTPSYLVKHHGATPAVTSNTHSQHRDKVGIPSYVKHTSYYTSRAWDMRHTLPAAGQVFRTGQPHILV